MKFKWNIALLSVGGLRTLLARLSQSTNFAVGFGLLGVGLIVASWIPLSFLAAVVASVSSVVGTMIWLPAATGMKTPDQALQLDNKRIDDAVSKARLEWESDSKSQLIEDLRGKTAAQFRENEDLQKQIANLRATQMTATSWQRDWEMVLLEVDHKISDWQEQRLHEADSSTFSRAETHVYRGLLEKSFKAKLGFSLERLRVHQPPGSTTLLVSMPKVALVGISNIQTDWRHKHIEVSLTDGTIRSSERRIDDKHPRLTGAAEEQSKYLEARVNNGVDLQYLHAPVSEMAKRILHSMLGPLGHDIQFVAELAVPGVTLDEFLNARRLEAEERLTRLQARQQQVLASI